MFHLHKNSLLQEEVKFKKLEKRKDKTTFLDTVVFGIVFRKPRTESQLKFFKARTRK